MVAQPIQDMSAVSITHKTVGVRLPRLWCGAIGLAVSACGSLKTGIFPFPFVHGGGGWLRRSGVFESAMKTERTDDAIYAKIRDGIIICNNCFSAIKAVGRYGQIIPLSGSRKQIQK
jgi:hypothetical protein